MGNAWEIETTKQFQGMQTIFCQKQELQSWFCSVWFYVAELEKELRNLELLRPQVEAREAEIREIKEYYYATLQV